MPTSLPLLNALSAPKTASSSIHNKGTHTPASTSAVADEGGQSFKQSLQKVTPKAKEATPAADNRAEVDPAEDRDQDGAEVSVQLTTEFAHLLNMRHPLVGIAQSGGTDTPGLSYLASLADGGAGAGLSFSGTGTSTGAPSILPSAGMEGLLSASLMPATEVPRLQLAPEMVEAAQHFHRTLAERVPTGMNPADGKMLPQWLTAIPAVAVQPQVAVDSTATSVGGTLLDATGLSGLLNASQQQSGGINLKALLSDGAFAPVVADAFSEQAAAVGQPSEGFAQTLSASALANVSLSPMQLEGRTAIPMTVTFGHAQWSNSLAERTLWMAGQAIHSAEIQLDPPELGPLQVRIQVNQDQASVSFVSANPQVRDALEQTMGRLRELFQEQGLELVDSGVADHQSKQQRDPDGHSVDSVSDEHDESIAADLQTLVTPVPWGVDYYV